MRRFPVNLIGCKTRLLDYHAVEILVNDFFAGSVELLTDPEMGHLILDTYLKRLHLSMSGTSTI